MRATNRRYVTESEIRAAKQIDLLTYLQTYEPHELVKDGSGYHTRTHDSLKISNGMWHWFSRGIPFSIDIGVGDVIVPKARERELPVRLKGFEPVCVLTYSMESTIAEKFEAILRRMEATSRMKDFYDLYT